jgi:hypothetical protein
MTYTTGIAARTISIVLVVCLRMNPVAHALEHDKPFGEPYQLAGKRIVFTTWYFVRPGQPDWQKPDGAGGYSGDAKVGAFDAAFKYYEHPFGIRLVAERAQHVGPIIAREQPWEKMGITVNTVIFENGKFRAWANCQDAQRRGNYAYYESTDGRTWHRPSLGLIEYEGSRDNNLFGYPAIAVFVDPTAPPEQRYKTVKHSHYTPESLERYKEQNRPISMMVSESGSGWGGDCIVGAVSPDGYNWSELPEPLSIEPSDTHVIAAYDARLKKYIMFTRSHMVGPRAEGQPISTSEDKRHNYVPRRAVGRSESDEFARFPLSQVILEPGSEMPPTDTYYSNCYTTIPGAPDHHVMFPAIYHQTEDTTSIELFASYDSKVWHRAPGGPVLDTTTFGEWDGGCVFTRPNLVELPNGDWAVPYTGYVYPHKYPRGAWGYDAGLAVWPKGRLMSLQANDRGQFSTVAFVPPGTRLKINALTERAGSILIEAADLSGKPIAGRTFHDAVALIGDHHWSAVKWKSADDLGVKAGAPVLLRFILDKAKVYGLEFE